MKESPILSVGRINPRTGNHAHGWNIFENGPSVAQIICDANCYGRIKIVITSSSERKENFTKIHYADTRNISGADRYHAKTFIADQSRRFLFEGIILAEVYLSPETKALRLLNETIKRYTNDKSIPGYVYK